MCRFLVPFLASCALTGVQSFTIPSNTNPSTCSSHAVVSSHLFQDLERPERTFDLPSARRAARQRTQGSRNLPVHASKFVTKTRRSATIMCASIAIWLGAAALNTPPSEAVTTLAPATESQMIESYVKKHMFDDDVYDPVESVYREAMQDRVKGTYPKALSAVTQSVLGQEGVKVAKEASEAGGIGGLLLSAINFLQRRGLSEQAAVLLLTGSFVVAGPIAFVCAGMMVGAQSKRQINSVMKKRYGDTYSVDATIKVEDDVEVPDEDEDEDDDDDEDEDDDDDEDEDDD